MQIISRGLSRGTVAAEARWHPCGSGCLRTGSFAAVIGFLNRRPASLICGEFEELIMVSKDRRDVL
jgi:hypothetical protein